MVTNMAAMQGPSHPFCPLCMEVYLCESLRCWTKYPAENTQKMAATPSLIPEDSIG